jgi:transposase
VALEATGAYHAPLLAALGEAGLPVALANPAQVKAFRQTLLARNKTDRADALLLARFARAHADTLVRYAPPPAAQRRLREVLAYREQLVARRTALRNHLEAARWRGDAELAALLEDDLADATRRLRAADARVKEALAALPEAAPLQAACGVGPLVAAALLAYLPAAVWGAPKQAAACAGVHPAVRASGKTAHSALARAGSARLRRYLYLAALAARTHDPALRAFFDRLVGRGKAPKTALAALMHKLLRHAMGRLRAWRATRATAP